MKNLINILKTIAITTTTIPTVISVVPASYEKNTISNKIKALSKLNWTGLNTTRNKRTTNQQQNSKHIFKTNGNEIPTEQQIKEKVKQLNPQLDINKMKIDNITNNSANISIIGFSSIKTINFTVDKSFDIKTKITNTNLGSILTDGFTLSTEQQIKEKVKQLNPQLDINKIKIEKIANNSAEISSTDLTIYSGTVTVNYTISLNSFIKTTNLGSILTDGFTLPTEQQIKEKVKQSNPILQDTNSISILHNTEIKNITTSNAKLIYKWPNIYTDTINITFTVNVDLSKKITISNLGEFITEKLKNPTEQQIKEKVKQLNPQLDINKIKIENITNNNAKISSLNSAIYTGTVTVNYSVSINSLNW
ncbi:hypothetical protein [Spiroplasma endosymbiont of Lonchoptera lutea]|uniref:hypothetical protein n=1 Tax=Spiroplasma endosymbiont of Lonchoptera lutea TaxID=3066297 RepID=UPI0030CFFFC7